MKISNALNHLLHVSSTILLEDLRFLSLGVRFNTGIRVVHLSFSGDNLPSLRNGMERRDMLMTVLASPSSSKQGNHPANSANLLVP